MNHKYIYLEANRFRLWNRQESIRYRTSAQKLADQVVQLVTIQGGRGRGGLKTAGPKNSQ